MTLQLSFSRRKITVQLVKTEGSPCSIIYGSNEATALCFEEENDSTARDDRRQTNF